MAAGSPPLTVQDANQAPTQIFGYRLITDPKPGTKIFHNFANKYVVYGVASLALPYMTPNVKVTDITPLIGVTYDHHAGQVFEIEAPNFVHVAATQEKN